MRKITKIRSSLKDKDKIPENIQLTNGIKPKRVSCKRENNT
jgi:hypothetical protein